MMTTNSTDEQKQKQLVLDTITQSCLSASSSSPPIFQKINVALQNGGKPLEATILSGGITNFSYKVHTTSSEGIDLTVFAKLSFEYALFNPGAFHDLARTANEYEMMKNMSTECPDCIVAPLACMAVQYEDNNDKLQRGMILVTEWSTADEQFGTQFSDGCVDERVAPQLANTLATLHLMKDYDPEFNVTVKPCFAGLLQMAKGVVEGLCTNKEGTPKDRTEAYCREIGADALLKVMDANITNYDQRDCLIHGDSHVFNMLVEPKPCISELEEFGPNGTFILCDWETCMAGPIGKDIGAALAGPIGCLVGHALNIGSTETSIDKYINTLLDVYLSRMAEGGKTQEEMSYMIRNAAGWAGWTQFVVFYFLGVQLDAFGVEDEGLKTYVRDALGFLGLRLMCFSYGDPMARDDTNSQDTLQKFKDLYKEEVERAITDFASRRRRMMPRKSSILRGKSRRISDAALHLLATDSVARELSGCDIAE